MKLIDKEKTQVKIDNEVQFYDDTVARYLPKSKQL